MKNKKMVNEIEDVTADSNNSGYITREEKEELLSEMLLSERISKYRE